MSMSQAGCRRADVTAALLHDGAEVAVFRALYLGDLLCSIPSVRALKRANPAMRLTLVGLPWASEFAARFGRYFDDFIAIPPAPGLHDVPAGPVTLERALDECRSRRFDVVLQMHGSGPQSNTLVARMGASRVAGFHPGDAAPPDEGAFFPYPDCGTETERLLWLVRALGIEAEGTELEFPLTVKDEEAFESVARRTGIRDGGYACVHPGAKLVSRRWQPGAFASVADGLAGMGHQIVITGTQSERAIAEAVKDAMSHPATVLAGETALGTLGALIARSALLVCNDTGVSHIAAAVGTRSVVVACGSDAARWAPADQALHRTIAHDIDCRPCNYDVCPIGHPCATAITPAMIDAEARSLLLTMRCGPS